MTRRKPLKRNPRSRDEEDFKNWIRVQPCLVCQTTPSEPAHVATQDGPRAGIIPLCHLHHCRKGEGGGPESHHELGKNFWKHHFGENASADTWVNFYRNRYHAEQGF